jgi:hypothetical protein
MNPSILACRRECSLCAFLRCFAHVDSLQGKQTRGGRQLDNAITGAWET